MEEQELEASKYAPVIPPGEKRQEFPRFTPSGQVMIKKRPVHQQKTFLSGRTGCVRVDALRQSRQRHTGGGSLRARRQYHASSCISPSDRRFFSLCQPPTLNKHSGVVANCDHTSEWVYCVHACIGIAMHKDPRNCADPRNLAKSE